MTDHPIELQRAICLCMAVEQAEIAALHAHLADPASDRLRDALHMLRAEVLAKYQDVERLRDDLEIEQFEQTGEEP